MKAGVVLVGCLLAAMLCGWRMLSQRVQVTTAGREVAAVTIRTAATIAAIEREQHRLAAVEADTAQLLDKIATLSSERRQMQRSPRQEEISERHARARELAGRGAWQEALADYIWCYDRAFLRTSGLVKNFVHLAARYPPAAAELQVRLQEAEARVRDNAENTDALQDFITLDSALNQSARSFAFHDELPESDERRRRIARALVSEFIALQRYHDVSAVVPPFDATVADLDACLRLRREVPRVLQLPNNEHQRFAIERARAAQLKAAMDTGALVMEVLAGIGESDRARQIQEKILLLDSSPETRAELNARLQRARMTNPGDLQTIESAALRANP